MPRVEVIFGDHGVPIELDEIPGNGDLIDYGGTTYEVVSRTFVGGGGTQINVRQADAESDKPPHAF